MPLYEYKCENCGDVFEVIQKFSDETLTAHEKCGGKVERLISTSALQFKGSGWYVNDYAKGSKSASNGDSAKKESGDNSSGKDGSKESSKESSAAKSEPAASSKSSDSSSSSTPSSSSSDKK